MGSKSLFKQVSLKLRWEFSAVIFSKFLSNERNKVLVC